MGLDVSLVEDKEIYVAYEDRPFAKINGVLCEPSAISSTRHSYLYKDLIVKVDNYAQTHSPKAQGHSEIIIWQKLDSDESKLFVPLIEWGEVKPGVVWVAQKFIQDDGMLISEKAIAHFRDVMNKYKIYDYSYCPDDGSRSNVLTENDQIKIYDWGCNSECNS